VNRFQFSTGSVCAILVSTLAGLAVDGRHVFGVIHPLLHVFAEADDVGDGRRVVVTSCAIHTKDAHFDEVWGSGVNIASSRLLNVDCSLSPGK
jgi:hypothetical protein